MIVSTILAIFTIYVPFMNNVFGTAPVPAEFWFLPMVFGVTLFSLDEIRKLILRNQKTVEFPTLTLDCITTSS